MKIKKYLDFLNEDSQAETEAESVDLKSEIESLLTPESKDLKLAIVEKIIKSLKTEGRNVFDEFIQAYIVDDEKNKIQELINDADVYEFYLSYRNDIDELLSKINFYKVSPSDPKLNSFSLYDYLVKGTLRAVKECVIRIKEDTTKSQGQAQSQSTPSSEESEM